MNEKTGIELLPVLFVTVVSLVVGLLLAGIPSAAIAAILGFALYAMMVSEVEEDVGEETLIIRMKADLLPIKSIRNIRNGHVVPSTTYKIPLARSSFDCNRFFQVFPTEHASDNSIF